MNFLMDVLQSVTENFSNQGLPATTVMAVLLVTILCSVYEYHVYRIVSHRGFYNKSFNISISVIPLFIATIILSLQSDIVITLGTIGALAIIRFRTAVKDPVDMLYILWSVHIGITCGCQLYELAVLTCIVVTIMLIAYNHMSFGKLPFVVVLQTEAANEARLIEAVRGVTKRYKIKNATYASGRVDMVIEVSGCKREKLTEALNGLELDRFSIVEYDSEDVL